MRRQVVRTEIGLDLDDSADALHAGHGMHEVHAEQVAGYLDRVAIVEAPRKASMGGQAPMVRAA